jgi:thiamine biosynthesis lipoprotein
MADMKDTRLIMGMPIEIEISAGDAAETLEAAFASLVAVDERFSTYKDTSEVSLINRSEVALADASAEMCQVFALADLTKEETDGYFDIRKPDGTLDPSGIVKGWAIKRAAELIRAAGFGDYFVNAGGDIASSGKNAKGEDWSVGIRNPFNADEIVKVIYPRGKGVATSGSYLRGAHIYNPHAPEDDLREIVSITVIGPDVLEADRFATAAFAMGKRGIEFIEKLPGFEAYTIDAKGIATMTSSFEEYTK